MVDVLPWLFSTIGPSNYFKIIKSPGQGPLESFLGSRKENLPLEKHLYMYEE